MADTTKPSPAGLWQQASGDGERYRQLMRELGYVLQPGDERYEQGSRKPPCGWEPGKRPNATTLPPCPTPCDADCELGADGCHEAHEVPSHRGHQPHGCLDIRRAIAEAVKAERERLLGGPVTRIEPDPDQPGYNRGVFDFDAAVAQAVARERERIRKLAETAQAVYLEACDDKPYCAHGDHTMPFAELIREPDRQGATDG